MPNTDQAKPGKPKVVLTIAGFDPSSGAGITADLQVFAAHGLFGTAAITALTVQSTLGVSYVEAVRAKTLRATLDHLVADLPPAGIKIGMLGSAEAVQTVADFVRSLSDVGASLKVPVVLDPVLRSSSGAALLVPEALEALRAELLPLVSWITPNLQELIQLVRCTGSGFEELASSLGEDNPGLFVVATGGDEEGVPTDRVRYPSGRVETFHGQRVETRSNHGTGCAFSSALLSQLVLGKTSEEAVTLAKRYVEGALRSAPGLGSGNGPMDLLWPMRSC